MSARIPVTVFSGFLGAGKTTLIQHVVEECPGLSFAIVVNEFGAVSIDGQILARAGSSPSIHNITSGLVGYEGDGAFIPMMLSIAQDKKTERVVIETSGLAVPTAVIEKLACAPLNEHFLLDAVATVIDAPWLLSAPPLRDPVGNHVEDQVDEVFSQQIAAADIIVLNKIDELSHDDLHQAEHIVRHAAPTVRFMELAYGAKLDPRVILDARLHEPRHRVATHAPAKVAVMADAHSHSGLDAHEHGLLTHEHLHEHDAGWLSFSLHSHDVQNPDTISNAIKTLARTQPLLRAKGFFCAPNHRFAELQCVRDRVTIAPVNDSGRHHSELIFIGYHLDRATITQQMTELTQTNWE